MMIRNATLSAAGLMLLGVLAAPAQAAPLSAPGLSEAQQQGGLVEKTRYARRHCWRHRGVWVCRRYVRRYYPYAYWGPGYAYGPSLGFYFGGGGHRGHHGGHHGGHHHRR